MSAAHVAAVGDAVAHEAQRGGVVAYDPFHAEVPDLALEAADGRLELALLDGDGHELVGERRATAVRYERVEQTEAVLAPRHTDGDPLAGAQHRKVAHGPPDEIEHTAF